MPIYHYICSDRIRSPYVRNINNIESENGIILLNLAEKAENRVVTFRNIKQECADLIKEMVGMYHGYAGGLSLITRPSRDL